jgi:hypothetical protein
MPENKELNENKKLKELKKNEPRDKTLPEYETPKIITYTSDDILKEIGPAQACSPSPTGMGGFS